MSDVTYDLKIVMSCGGCSGAVTNKIKALKGVKNYEVSLEKQSATIVAEPSLDLDTVITSIAKTGKTITEVKVNGVKQTEVSPAVAPLVSTAA